MTKSLNASNGLISKQPTPVAQRGPSGQQKAGKSEARTKFTKGRPLSSKGGHESKYPARGGRSKDRNRNSSYRNNMIPKGSKHKGHVQTSYRQIHNSHGVHRQDMRLIRPHVHAPSHPDQRHAQQQHFNPSMRIHYHPNIIPQHIQQTVPVQHQGSQIPVNMVGRQGFNQSPRVLNSVVGTVSSRTSIPGRAMQPMADKMARVHHPQALMQMSSHPYALSGHYDNGLNGLVHHQYYTNKSMAPRAQNYPSKMPLRRQNAMVQAGMAGVNVGQIQAPVQVMVPSQRPNSKYERSDSMRPKYYRPESSRKNSVKVKSVNRALQIINPKSGKPIVFVRSTLNEAIKREDPDEKRSSDTKESDVESDCSESRSSPMPVGSAKQGESGKKTSTLGGKGNIISFEENSKEATMEKIRKENEEKASKKSYENKLKENQESKLKFQEVAKRSEYYESKLYLDDAEKERQSAKEKPNDTNVSSPVVPFAEKAGEGGLENTQNKCNKRNETQIVDDMKNSDEADKEAQKLEDKSELDKSEGRPISSPVVSFSDKAEEGSSNGVQSDSNEKPDAETQNDQNNDEKKADGKIHKSEDDSVGGPYVPQPIKQNRVSKRKKIVFTREQLMTFQPKCKTVPRGFPMDLMKEIIMTEMPPPVPQPQIRQSNGAPVEATENLTGPEKPMPANPEVIVIAAPQIKKPIIPLAKSANRWQPASARMSVYDKLMQKVMGILNKLSPEPGKHEGLFERLFELVKLCCRSSDDLKGICNQVFDKAVTEAHYAGLYAKLCIELSIRCPTYRVEKKLPNGSKISRVAEFKTIILTKCQKEFQGISKQTVSLKEKLKSTKDEDTRDILEIKLKKRRKGNVRFIGELFKAGFEANKMERVLHKCIQHLLRDITNPAEEEIVCLEVLLNTAGRKLDHQRARKYMEMYFKRIRKMSTNPHLPTRLVFKCKDLLDLRKRRWSSRRNEEVRSVSASNESRGANRNAPPRPDKRREPVALPRRVGNRYGAFASTASQDTQEQKKVVEKKIAPKKEVSFDMTPPKSDEKMEKDIVSLIREYFAGGKRGLAEAALCVEDLKSPSHHWMVVRFGVLLSLEKKDRERKLTVELLLWLCLTKKLLSSSDFEQGLKSIFDELSDIKVDIPYAGQFLIQMCQAFIKYKCISKETYESLVAKN
mmetsp:Transcript_7498/g.11352  ORF Transcript_7498/g.11352 Transcript_7498/m.11352 type:complete len:1164 (+) Transcript_7498:32-3523(+)